MTAPQKFSSEEELDTVNRRGHLGIIFGAWAKSTGVIHLSRRLADARAMRRVSFAMPKRKTIIMTRRPYPSRLIDYTHTATVVLVLGLILGLAYLLMPFIENFSGHVDAR
jgi:hypothetical protein